ncbi:GspE/PulE family protein [Shewanella glacialipiscicola]|uniref:GspE/PulE family protein n=1 Tax=Shewanella glacialipiscicola TaxID=614069 RepID=UPI003D795203
MKNSMVDIFDQYDQHRHGEIEVFDGGISLAHLLENLSEKFGYCVPSKNGYLLIDETVINKDEDILKNLFAVLSDLSRVTGKSDFNPIKANRAFVYESYEKALELLNKAERHSKNDDDNASIAEQILNLVIKEAIKRDAADIHIKITDDTQAKIFFRVDGVIDTTPLIRSKADAIAMIGHLFDYSGHDNTESSFHPGKNNSTSIHKDIEQDSAMKRVELRVEYRSQTKDDKACIIRLLAGTDKYKTLESAGVKPDFALVLRKFICQSFGIILISGPTGAGKSTLLNCVIAEKPKNRVLHSVENPIEARHSDPLVFQGLMSDDVTQDIVRFLRYDPDIGAISEMRLGDEVKAAMALSRTGHLILSSIHATDAISVIDRLCDMGVTRSELAERNLLRMLTGQRLVPLLCNQCKIQREKNGTNNKDWADKFELVKRVASPEAVVKLNNFALQICFESENGCEACEHTGRKGRQSVYEYVVIDDEARQFIRENNSLAWVKSLKSRGWKSMADHTWELIKNGQVDPEVADAEVPDVLVASDHWVYNE